MLSQEDNTLLTRVGRGTPMGELLRRFWLPVLLSWELEADGPPERVRLLGEDLLAFRETGGGVGVIDERCPHRRASLYFGRNEAGGLRCIYHGWKVDVRGQCVDMPSEPPESNFKEKVRVKCYPVAERCGVVWVYMGPRPTPPPLPDLEWLGLPESHAVFSKRVQYSNWVQGLEGDIDQSHLSFTHSRLHAGDGVTGPGGSSLVDQIRKMDTHPQFEVLDTEYGTLIGAGRNAPGDMKYWRITQQMMPFHTITGPYGEDPMRNWRAWVPIDDENVFVIGCSFHPHRPLTDDEREHVAAPRGTWTISPELRAPRTSAPFGRWRPLPDLGNDFFQDRELQKKETYSGIREFWAQDAAPQLSMGKIADRAEERLGTSDLAIIAVRKRLLREARALAEEGEEPAEVDTPEVYRIRSDAVLIPAGASWIAATAERRKVVAGVNPACP
jgi:phthalate 4,5-dioxygenase oxygenase subunit